MKRQRSLAAKFEELKFIDLSDAPAAYASGVNFDAMSMVEVPRDTSASGRVGQKIAIQSLDFSFNITSDLDSQAAGVSNSYSRNILLAVVRIQDHSSAVITAFPLVASTATQSVYNNTLQLQGMYVRDLDHTHKYKVLFVKLVTQMSKAIYTAAVNPIDISWPTAQIRGRISFKEPVVTEFAVGDLTGAPNQTDRNMILMCGYNMPITGCSTRGVSVGMACRTRYYD